MQMKVNGYDDSEQAPGHRVQSVDSTVHSRGSVDMAFDSAYPSAKAGVTRRSLSKRRLSSGTKNHVKSDLAKERIEDSARGEVVTEDAVYPKSLAFSTRPAHSRRSFGSDGSFEFDPSGIDFLQDPPEQMTYGRKIALSLLSKKWYNPRAETKKYDDVEASEYSLATAPSLKKAWAYFEHVVLTRYVVADHNVNVDKWGFLRKFMYSLKNHDEDFERAQPGENNLPTKLYDPVTTPHMQVRQPCMPHLLLVDFPSCPLTNSFVFLVILSAG